MAEFQNSEIIIFVLAGTAALFVLLAGMALFIVTYQKKLLKEHKRNIQLEYEHSQKMIKAQLESQELERVRIAAELHDSLGSLLWSVKLNSSYIQRVGGPNANTDHIFYEMNNILDQSIETVRRISWELTPQAFKDAGLSNSVQRLCSRLNGKGKSLEFSNNGDVLLNNETGLNIYRVIQELLNNAIKHSEAERIGVALSWGVDTLEVQVEDNGKGFELNEVREGVGWWNITQRANQLKAKIHMGKPPMGNGTRITLIIPLENGTR